MNQAYLVWRWLEAKGVTDFAFILRGDNCAWYAEPYQYSSGATSSATVNLIQGLNPTGSGFFDPFSDVYATHSSTMGTGMAYFIGKQVVGRPPPPLGQRTLEGIADSSTVLELIDSLEAPKPTRIDPASVLERPALARWIYFARGPDPHVSLRAGRETHLHRLYMMAAVENARYMHSGISPASGYPIVAIMATATGRVLGWAGNTSDVNHTFHAEINLVQAVAASGVSAGDDVVVYSTLQPCVMCAGMIAEQYPGARVVYLQKDPGRHCMYMGMRSFIPRGGLHQLGAAPVSASYGRVWNHRDRTSTVFKPLRGYGSGAVPTGNVGGEMDAGYASQKTGMIRYLRGEEAGASFGRGAGIWHKYGKYTDQVNALLSGQDGSRTKDVARVVAHLAPMMGYDFRTL